MKSRLSLCILAISLFTILCAKPQNVNKAMDIVRCITTHNNEIWIGTNGGVIVRDSNGKLLQTYTTSEGLAYNSVCAIAFDQKGNSWFAAEGSGVSVFNGK